MGDDSTVRTPLSRERILAAALVLVDAEGLDGLSMRRLAAALGCGPMSLYNHVEDKDDVRRQLVEEVLSRIELPAPGVVWRPAVAALAHGLRDQLAAHPWMCPLWFTTRPGPARTGVMEALLRCLREGGFAPGPAFRGAQAVELLAVGHAQAAHGLATKDRDSEHSTDERLRRFLARTPSDAYPHLVEYVLHHGDGEEQEDGFGFVLDLLLDGLARHLPAS